MPACPGVYCQRYFWNENVNESGKEKEKENKNKKKLGEKKLMEKEDAAS